jgi:AcrR family transcriptional regulator
MLVRRTSQVNSTLYEMSSALPTQSEPTLVWLREEPCSRSPGHSRARIAAAAVELADEEGFEAVSMRRVAERLGAGTMTLYHYVANKDELVTLMLDRVMGEILIPDEELPREWRPALAAIANSSLAALRRHRWMLDRLGDSRPGPSGLRHFEQSLQAMAAVEVGRQAKFETIVLVDEYVFGFAIREAQEADEHARGWAPGVREFIQRELDSGQYPLIREFFGADAADAEDLVKEVFFKEGRFERGLDRLLDGIEAGFTGKTER